VNDRLTSDYWTIGLPNELATPASKSPALLAYLAPLTIHAADVLLSTTKVRSRLEPAISLKKGIERHHIFPRNFLKQRGVTDLKRINQIANFAMVEWSDNIKIADLPPGEYWPQQVAGKSFEPQRLATQRDLHALPEGWETMEYDEFLQLRRKLMADVVRRSFELLRSHSYTTPVDVPAPETVVEQTATQADPSMSDLLDSDLIQPGVELIANTHEGEVVASVLPDGRLHYDDETFGSLIELSDNLGIDGSPWQAWAADLPDGRVRLVVLRELLL
jgi:hypothetical protein